VLKSLATLAVQAMGRLSEEGAARVGLAAELAASAAFADARARFSEAAERVEAAARAIADAEPHEAGASEAALARIGFAIDEGITRIEAALLAGSDLPSRLDAGVAPTSEIAHLAEAPADGFAWLDSVETRGAPLLHEPEAVAEGGLPRRREV